MNMPPGLGSGQEDLGFAPTPTAADDMGHLGSGGEDGQYFGHYGEDLQFVDEADAMQNLDFVDDEGPQVPDPAPSRRRRRRIVKVGDVYLRLLARSLSRTHGEHRTETRMMTKTTKTMRTIYLMNLRWVSDCPYPALPLLTCCFRSCVLVADSCRMSSRMAPLTIKATGAERREKKGDSPSHSPLLL